MKPPPRTPNEAARLSALHETGLLDTEAEERFDRYTRLASRLFDVPIALVTLVDSDRQWFKSRVGLAASQTSRDISFCGHAIVHDAPLVVRDATADPRFHDNPLVEGDPSIRFYAGAPIRGADGHALGTLCLIDRRPREFDADDLVALRDLAGLVEGELALVQAASTDPLTGLSNRSGFLRLARRALLAAAVRDQPLVLLYADLTGFKAINDNHGHAAGDDALREFAQPLLRSFRDSDVVGRMGGDEFCVLATVGSASDGEYLAVRLRPPVRAPVEHRARALRRAAAPLDPRPDRGRGRGDARREARSALTVSRSPPPRRTALPRWRRWSRLRRAPCPRSRRSRPSPR
jgi:diguanylate cyclase (GGDEF)-like protein